MDRNRLTGQLAALTAMALLGTACMAASGDKSGGSAPPAQLLLASNDGNLDGIPGIVHFVDRVAELSDGQLTVRVESRWEGGDDERRVIEDVAAGKADLGWAGTRAFDEVGVDAFRPLHAPFLFPSYAAEAAVVGDGLAAELVRSVEPLGLTGLSLLADEMRHPAGVEEPLLNPADFRGVEFATVASGAQSDGLAALGAIPTAEPIRLAAADGLGGLETMWWTYDVQNYAEIAPFITANANLWPRTYVLFANGESLADLDVEERGWVTRAATEASDWSTSHAGTAEAAEIAQACADGARVVTATPDQLAALRAAAEPVYAALRSDLAQRSTLERIEALVGTAPADAPAEVPPGCAYEPGEELAPPLEKVLTGPGSPGELPAGVYRYELSVDEMRGDGRTDDDIRNNAGVWTWTLRDGTWSYEMEPVSASATSTSCEGWYDVRGAEVAFTRKTVQRFGDCAPPTWTARWSAEDRLLTWTRINVADFDHVFAPRPWEQID